MSDLSARLKALSPEKRELILAKLRQKEGPAEGEKRITIPVVSRDEAIPLSFAQQRLWFLDQLERNGAAYNIPAAYRLVGSLDVKALEESITMIVQRHESLRTTFVLANGHPVQRISSKADVHWLIEDLRSIPASERDLRAQELAIEEAQKPFDLTQGPLLRVKLLNLSDTVHVLLLTMHHIVSDAWSMGVFNEELAHFYEALSTGRSPSLPRLPVQYADFAVWQQRQLENGVLEKQLDYWRNRLAGVSPSLALPTDYPRPPVQTYNGRIKNFQLDSQLTQQIHNLSQETGATLFMILLAAFATLLHHYSRQEDIVVGTPITERNRRELESLIGFLVNTVALRITLKDTPSFVALVKNVRQTVFDAFAHQDAPFEQIVELLNVERNPSHNPLFQVMFIWQNEPVQPFGLPGLDTSLLGIENGTSKFDLSLSLENSEQSLFGSWEYNSDLFHETTIERLTDHFRNLLSQIVANPEQPVANYVLPGDAERNRLLVELNQTGRNYPENECVHHLFAVQAARTPREAAVTFGGQTLTYEELNARANRLAHRLQVLGVGPDTHVGLFMERSLDLVVGVLGTLKAGGAYVPLDPVYPKERLAFMIGDSETAVLLTHKQLVPDLPPTDARVICLDAEWHTIAQESSANPASGVVPSNLGYIIYTSGSTGIPKGVALTHAALYNLIMWQLQHSVTPAQPKTMQFAPISFDVSFQEIFSTLCAGGTLVLISEAMRRDTPALLHFLIEEEIDRLFLPFVALQQLAEVAETYQLTPTSLREVVTAGEQLQITPAIATLFRNLQHCTLRNHYGPSESHVVTSYTLARPVDDWPALPPIGTPIANVQIYILNNQLQPVPIGVHGELYIGGVALARGYLNRPTLTSTRFVPDPFGHETGARLYRTGDLACYLPDGNIQFLGRIDNQVKVRGFRIELGEIEAVLTQHEAVRETAVIVHEYGTNNKQIVAYVVCEQEREGIKLELGQFLREKLPGYMVPSAFVVLQALPLTPSGKVDRRALPPPDVNREDVSGLVSPRDRLELQLVQIWESILSVRPIGIHHNFFELGGHSLLAVRLMTQIRHNTGKTVPLSLLFQTETVANLATAMRKELDGVEWSPLIPIQPNGNKSPFFCIHPGGGNVFCYMDLAHYLGPEQPFYGLQARGIEYDQQPIETVTAMAAEYVPAIQSIQPEGPYFIGGWSVGGLIAFEVAQRLMGLGSEVALLVLIDTYLFSGESYETFADEQLLTDFANDFFATSYQDVAQVVENMPPGTVDKLKYIWQQAQKQGLLPADIPIAQIKRLFQVFKANIRAAEAYQPGSYSGNVVMLRARDALDSEDVASLGWERLVVGDLSVNKIPGSHFTMIQKPQVQVLAEKLGQHLRRTQGGANQK